MIDELIMKKWKFALYEWVALCAVLMVFVFLTVSLSKYEISQNDGNQMLFRMRGLLNGNNSYVEMYGRSVEICDRVFPLNICQNHIGIDYYMYLPFLAVFGVGHYAYRIAALFFGVLTLIGFYLFSKELFNKRIAFANILLLGTNISFIVSTCFAVYSGSAINTLFTGALLFLLIDYKYKSMFAYCTGMLLLGLTLNTRAWAVWNFIAFWIAILFFYKQVRRHFSNYGVKGNFRHIVLGAVFMILGAMPLIYCQLISNWEFFSEIRRNFPVTYAGVNNLNYFQNIIVILKNFMGALSGQAVNEYKLASFNNDVFAFDFSRNIGVFVFFGSFIWFLASFFRKEGHFRNKKQFLLIFIILVLLQAPFTISDFGFHHLYILLPAIQCVIGVTLFELFHVLRKRFFKIVIILTFAFLPLANTAVILNKHLNIRTYGAAGINSNATNELIRWLQNDKLKPVFIDANLGIITLLLSKEEVIPCNLGNYGNINKDDLFKGLAEYLNRENAVFVFLGEEFEAGGYIERFERLIENKGIKIVKKKEFLENTGEVVYAGYMLDGL